MEKVSLPRTATFYIARLCIHLLKFPKQFTVSFLIALFTLFILVPQASAFSCSSNGTGGGNFNLASTWNSCNSTTPQTTDSVTINNGDTVSLVATTTVTGITINSGGIFDANTRTLTNTDGYTNNGSHTGTTSTMTLSGASGTTISGTGSYTPTGIVTISTGNKTIDSASELTFDKITVTTVTLTNNSTSGFTIVTALAGTGQLTQGVNGVLDLGGTSTITSLDASASPNEVYYTSTAANQTIKAPTSAYHHLFIDKSGRVGTLAAATTINGNLTVIAGTLSDGGFQITGNATGTFTLSASTTLTIGTTATATSFPTGFTSGNTSLNSTSTVNYNSNSAQTISATPTYGNLTTTATSAVTKTAAAALSVIGLFTNGTNNVFADGGFTITLKDGATMTGTHTGSGKILFTGGSAAHAVSGAGSFNNVELDDSKGVTQSSTTNIGGTLTITSGTWTTSSTLAVTGSTSITGTLTISSTTGTKTFNNITINSGGILSFTAAETLAENGNLTIASGGTMSFSSAGIVNIFGDLTVNGTGQITGTTGLWTFQKVGGGAIGGTTSSLSITGSTTFATQYSIAFPFTVTTFTVNSGITETNTSTITVNGTLAGTGTLTQSSNAILNIRSATITTLNATATGNIVHYIGGVAGTLKGTSYLDLDINKTTGFTATANGTVAVAGNLTVTSGSLSLASSTFTVTGTTDIYGTLTDTSGGGSGGNNVFQGLVNIHTGATWLGVIGEVCDFHFGAGLVNNGSSFTSSTGVYYFETNNQSITGSSSFTVDNLAVTAVQLTNSSTGTLTVGKALSGTGTFIQDTNSILNIAGTSTITAFTASATGNTVNFTGTAAQTVNSATYQTLNVSGNTASSVNITGNTTINSALTLGATIFSTSTSKVILGSAATYSRTSGYIYGTASKLFSSSTNFTYPIGDATNYAPLDLTLNSVSNSSSIDASTIGTDAPDTTSGISGINASQSVNRYWTLTNNGLTFASYALTLNFVSSDVDAGTNPTSMSIAKNTGGWNTLTSTCASTSCTSSGLTSMSQFQIGVPTSSSSGGGSSSSSSSDTSSSSTSTSSSSPADTSGITNAIQAAIGSPAQSLITDAASIPPALFDILSSPLLPISTSSTIFPVVAGAFLLAGFIGLIFLVLSHRQRLSRVLRISPRRSI